MDKREEAKFRRDRERFFKGHQPVPNGKNPVFWNMRQTEEMRSSYSSNFKRIFNSSGDVKPNNSSVDTSVNTGASHE